MTFGVCGHRLDDVVGERGRVRAGEPHPLEPVDRRRRRAAAWRTPAGRRTPRRSELTFCPSSVTSMTPSPTSASISASMSPGRRSFSLPRRLGTMQNVQVLLQPDRDRDPGGVRATRAGSAGSTGRPRATPGSRPAASRLCRARSSSAGSEPMLWVPKTTSTHGRPPDDLAAVLLGQAAADGDLHARARLLDRMQVAEVAVEPVVGVLPDRAGVEHHDVGLARRRSARGRSRRPPAARRAARSRGRSSGSRRYAPGRSAGHPTAAARQAGCGSGEVGWTGWSWPQGTACSAVGLPALQDDLAGRAAVGDHLQVHSRRPCGGGDPQLDVDRAVVGPETAGRAGLAAGHPHALVPGGGGSSVAFRRTATQSPSWRQLTLPRGGRVGRAGRRRQGQGRPVGRRCLAAAAADDRCTAPAASEQDGRSGGHEPGPAAGRRPRRPRGSSAARLEGEWGGRRLRPVRSGPRCGAAEVGRARRAGRRRLGADGSGQIGHRPGRPAAWSRRPARSRCRRRRPGRRRRSPGGP